MTGASTIAVVGGGISGLACALRLAEAGRKVTLFEASTQLGGLGTFFEYAGRTFEKFYHCLLPSDAPLLNLLERLQLSNEVYWKDSSFAYADGDRIFPLNRPVDLLRFSPLSLPARIRVGVTGLWGRLVSGDGLDDITTAEWLRRLSGRTAFAKFWQPMLEAKFGDRWEQIPALWFWTRFNREKGEAKGERKGYIRGGYKRVIDTLERRLLDLGVKIEKGQAIEAIEAGGADRPLVQAGGEQHRFDQCLIALPWPAFAKIAGENLRRLAAIDWTIDFQGVVNHVLFLKRPLTPHYWLATPAAEIPFDGVVETSTLTDETDRGADRHVVYLTKYMHRSDPRFSVPEQEIQSGWWSALRRLFPDLRDQDVEAQHLFRAPFVEPIYSRGYLKRRPPEVLVPGSVFLATTAQVYPTVTSWNGSVLQAERTLAAMLQA
jgi:protoporphyrinogen oxidase